MPADRRLPRFGLGHGLFGLSRGSHTVVLVVVLLIIAFAVYMAIRNSRG
jgi:hypothetical protein